MTKTLLTLYSKEDSLRSEKDIKFSCYLPFTIEECVFKIKEVLQDKKLVLKIVNEDNSITIIPNGLISQHIIKLS